MSKFTFEYQHTSLYFNNSRHSIACILSSKFTEYRVDSVNYHLVSDPEV